MGGYWMKHDTPEFPFQMLLEVFAKVASYGVEYLCQYALPSLACVPKVKDLILHQ